MYLGPRQSDAAGLTQRRPAQPRQAHPKEKAAGKRVQRQHERPREGVKSLCRPFGFSYFVFSPRQSLKPRWASTVFTQAKRTAPTCPRPGDGCAWHVVCANKPSNGAPMTCPLSVLSSPAASVRQGQVPNTAPASASDKTAALALAHRRFRLDQRRMQALGTARSRC